MKVFYCPRTVFAHDFAYCYLYFGYMFVLSFSLLLQLHLCGFDISNKYYLLTYLTKIDNEKHGSIYQILETMGGVLSVCSGLEIDHLDHFSRYCS